MMMNEKIRIRLKAYDYRILDQSTSEIVDLRVAECNKRPKPGNGERKGKQGAKTRNGENQVMHD